ncbi:hypothetical protein PINS_up012604 [Pythium insidiosum]|nr:hypothetical protein PINS_up012604 [Pythium insidiosum]
MTRPCSLTLSLLLALAACTTSVHAWPKFMSMVPNGRNVPFNKVDLGHAGGSMARNPFGLAFNVDRNWSKALCEADSDGDGQTNGQELGDPCCVWSIGKDAVLRAANDTSNPGNKSSVSDPKLWKDVDCAALQKQAASVQVTGAPWRRCPCRQVLGVLSVVRLDARGSACRECVARCTVDRRYDAMVCVP